MIEQSAYTAKRIRPTPAITVATVRTIGTNRPRMIVQTPKRSKKRVRARDVLGPEQPRVRTVEHDRAGAVADPVADEVADDRGERRDDRKDASEPVIVPGGDADARREEQRVAGQEEADEQAALGEQDDGEDEQRAGAGQQVVGADRVGQEHGVYASDCMQRAPYGRSAVPGGRRSQPPGTVRSTGIFVQLQQPTSGAHDAHRHARGLRRHARPRQGTAASPIRRSTCTSSETVNAALRGFADAGSDGIIQVSTGGAEFASGTRSRTWSPAPSRSPSSRTSSPRSTRSTSRCTPTTARRTSWTPTSAR